MHSHPPLRASADVTCQRPVFAGIIPMPSSDALVIIASPRPQQMGRRFELPDRQSVLYVGRDPSADVTLASEAVSRRHCRLTRDAMGWSIEDLQSTNGTFVNDEVVSRSALRSGDQIRVGDTVFKLLGGDAEGALLDQMLRVALRDPLTQAFTRAHFDLEAESYLNEVRAGQRRASLLVIDLDRFKLINDRWGHVCGDAVLRECALRLSRILPEDAVLARLGGEEFAVLLPSFGAASARLIAERLRGAVAGSPIACGDAVVDITCSVGLAEASRATLDVEQWVRAADDLLYDAKHNGRNRVEG